ncbi:hypothetical protein J4426_03470 [Candidatus Woesearchaeota archaeon]|nr:hypothetical protein [Candidatus Woesearchaeota archaeon]
MEKRGQFWYGDFMLAMLVMIVIGIIFANSIVDIPQRESDLDKMVDDGANIANSLLSDGYDIANWRNGNGRIGISSSGKIDTIKLDELATLVETSRGYLISKFLLGTSYDYAFYFEDKQGSIINGRAYGGIALKEDLNIVDAENIFRMVRIVFLDNNRDGKGELVKMHLAVWDIGKEFTTSKNVCQNAENFNFCGFLDNLVPEYRRGCCNEWEFCGVPPACDLP